MSARARVRARTHTHTHTHTHTRHMKTRVTVCPPSLTRCGYSPMSSHHPGNEAGAPRPGPRTHLPAAGRRAPLRARTRRGALPLGNVQPRPAPPSAPRAPAPAWHRRRRPLLARSPPGPGAEGAGRGASRGSWPTGAGAFAAVPGALVHLGPRLQLELVPGEEEGAVHVQIAGGPGAGRRLQPDLHLPQVGSRPGSWGQELPAHGRGLGTPLA